jgi:XTP/dITP diphosphohydrolase
MPQVIRKIIIGTNNEDKLKEMLPYFNVIPNLGIVTPKELGIQSPEEDGDSFHANAKIKADYYFEQSHFPAISEDSGLCIDALDGEPGIYTADWARECGSIENFFKLICKKLEAINPNYKNEVITAVFKLVFIYRDAELTLAEEASIKGRINLSLIGENGFGFDSFFIPDGYNKTFAELNGSEKDNVNPRVKALENLIKVLQAKGKL